MNEKHAFSKWVAANERYLESCRGMFVAVTFSAGKDSTACLHLLQQVRKTFDFELGAFLYAYPRHRYSPESLGPIETYWRSRIAKFIVKQSDESDDPMDRAAAEGMNPCRPCQDLRKSVLPEIFHLAGTNVNNTVIASGHSLWDLAGYALNLFTERNLVSGERGTAESRTNRFLEISQRFYPFLEMPEGYSIFRPMLALNAGEITAICDENSLPLLPTPCRYSEQRPKKALSRYFEQFGFRFEFEDVADFAKRFLELPDKGAFEQMSREEFLTKRF